jgi:hypothetical protein
MSGERLEHHKDSISEFHRLGKSKIKGTLTFEVSNPEITKGERSEHVKDSILEFRIPGVGGVNNRDSSSKES